MSLFVQDLTKYLGVLAWYWSGAFFNLISDLKKSFLSQITFKSLFNSIIPNAETPWCAKCVFFFDLGAPF